MARSINELPLDLNLTGQEKLVAQDSNNEGVAIPVSSLTNYVDSQIVKAPTITTQPTTFARQYPVVGEIKRGQGVSLYRDPADNIVKMRASDNSNLALQVGTESEFAQNVNDFTQDFSDLTERVVLKSSEVLDYRNEGYVIGGSYGGFVLTISENDDGNLEWLPPAGAVYTIGQELTRSRQDDQGILKRVFIDSTTRQVKYYVDVEAGERFRLFYAGVYNDRSISSNDTQSQTNGSSGQDIGEQTDFEITAGTISQSVYNRIVERGMIGVFISYNTSWTSSNGAYGIQSVTGANFPQQNFTQARETNGLYSETLVEGSSAIRRIWDSTAQGNSPYIFSSIYDRDSASLKRFLFTQMELNTDTNILSLTFGSNTGTTQVMELLAGGNRVILINNAARTQEITLTGTQVDLIKGANYVVQFRFANNVSALTNNLQRAIEIEERQSSFDYEFDYNLRHYIDGLRSLNTDANYTHSQGFVYQLSDTKLVLSTYIQRSHLSDLLVPESTGTGANRVNSFSGQEKVFTAPSGSTVGLNYARLLFVFEKENGAWVRKSTFRPVVCRVDKTGDSLYYQNHNFNNFQKVAETDSEYVLGLSTFSSQEYQNNQRYSYDGFNIVGTEARQDTNDNAVMFIKIDKTTSEMSYIINDGTTQVSNFFEDWRVHDNPLFSGDNNTPFYIMSQLNEEDSGKFKFFVKRTELTSLNEITKSAYNSNLDQWKIATIKNLRSSFSLSGYSTANSNIKHFYDADGKNLYTISNDFRNILTNSFATRIRFNADLTDFLRTYNTSTQSYDSDTAFISTSNNNTAAQTHNIFNFVISEDRFSEGLTTMSFSGNQLRGTPVHIEKNMLYGWSSNRTAGSQRTFVTFASGSRSVLFGRAPFNVVYFYNNSNNIVELRQLDNSVHENGFSFNFAPNLSIGLSLDAYSDGDTGTLGFLSGSAVILVNNGSLVEGSNYFIDLTTAELNTQAGRRIGRAISSTEILVNG